MANFIYTQRLHTKTLMLYFCQFYSQFSSTVVVYDIYTPHISNYELRIPFLFIPSLSGVWMQCDQIGRFFALWATFQSLWQIAHILGNFCKGVKIFYFYSGIIFGQFL